jgi:hypothetical protein
VTAAALEVVVLLVLPLAVAATTRLLCPPRDLGSGLRAVGARHLAVVRAGVPAPGRRPTAR